jgi:hypothetical protein
MPSLSVIAGNPRAELEGDEPVVTRTQAHAFRLAMRFVEARRAEVAKIGIAFDHSGMFIRQFLDPAQSQTDRMKRRPTLAHVHPALRMPYAEIAAEHGVAPEDIRIYGEDVSRSIMRQHHPRSPYAFSESPACCDAGICDSAESAESDWKVNCRGIMAGLMARAARDVDELHAFWQYEPKRMEPVMMLRGTELAHEVLGVRAQVRHRMLFAVPDGLYMQESAFRFDPETGRTAGGPEGRYTRLV